MPYERVLSELVGEIILNPPARSGPQALRPTVRAGLELTQISREGLHLWVRDTETPDAADDAWRRMYPSTHEQDGQEDDFPPPSATGEAERLAITCIGPARRGVTAQLAQRFADADSRVRAVAAVELDELTVAHGVVEAGSLPARPAPSGSRRSTTCSASRSPIRAR